MLNGNKGIELLVKDVLERTKHITAPRPPDRAKTLQYKQALRQVESLRGRGLFYPYIGSGLGRGPLVELEDGSVKLDFICGIGVHILGHSHPEILKSAIKGALEDVVMQGHLQANGIYIQCLKKLVSLAGRNSRLAYGWLCPSGSMANENALKVIRQKKKGARFILAFERAFAGRTTLMAEITHNPKIKEGLPVYNEVLRLPFCPEDPEKALKVLKRHWAEKGEDIACLIAELMQGDGGCYRASREFFQPIFEFCRNQGITVWIDEIQTFCRSGEFFAFEKLNLGDFIDVCTVGKAFQMSAALWTKEYNPRPGLVSGTFASSSSSLHCGKAVLDILENGYIGSEGRILRIFKLWRKHLQNLEEEGLISDIDGWGLMMGVTPLDGSSEKTTRLLRLLFQKGLLAFSCGQGEKKRIRFLLPAIVKDSHLEQAVCILRETLLEIKRT